MYLKSDKLKSFCYSDTLISELRIWINFSYTIKYHKNTMICNLIKEYRINRLKRPYRVACLHQKWFFWGVI